MNSKAVLLGLIVAVGGGQLRALGETATPNQVTAVNDSFDWASGIVSGLALLAPPPRIIKFAAAPVRRREDKTRRRSGARLSPAGTVAAAAPAFIGRHLKLKKNTVFGIFDVQVDENSPGSFDLIIASAEPAENVQVKDVNTKAIYVDKPLDDEKVFKFHVAAPLTSTIAVSVSVLQDGDINKAYFPLLGNQ